MDYADYGMVRTSPLASSVVAIVGTLLVLGNRPIEVAAWLAIQAGDRLRALLLGLTHPYLVCVVLLTLPAILPGSSWLLSLRGSGPVDIEMESASTVGYYEELIRSSTSSARPKAAEPVAVDRPGGWKPFAESGIVESVPDYARRRLRPNLDVAWNGSKFRTNAMGYRGEEFPREKRPGTFRVVVLGSSNTLGHGVDDDHVYTTLLQRWLADRVGAGGHAEVVNLAISGDSPTQRLLRLRDDVVRLAPDWILCDVTALDFSLEEQHLRWVVETRPVIPFDFVRETVSQSGINPSDSPDKFHRKLSPFLKPMMDRTFEGWAIEAGRIGAPITLVILPRADSKVESPGLFRLFREMADRHGLAYVDLSDLFEDRPLETYRVAPWDHHPNPLGHRLIFEGLRDALIGDRSFAAKIPSISHVK